MAAKNDRLNHTRHRKIVKQVVQTTPRWLVKSEPSTFSWQDLLRAPNQTTCWDGVRNYQARNYLRDGFQLGDFVFFYQSCTRPLAIVGTMRVVRVGYADPTQYDPGHTAFDPASRPDAPRWMAVDLQADTTFTRQVTLEMLREEPACAQMPLLQRGTRLSVQPVSRAAASCILRLADGRAAARPGG